MKKLAFISTFGAWSLAWGGVGGMDHIEPVNTDLVSTVNFGRIQVFTDTPNLSRMVIEDFFADRPTLASAAFAFELTSNDRVEHPDGWQISVWTSAADAATSGNDLTGNTVATLFVRFEDHNWTISPLDGTGATNFASRIDFSDLNMDIGTGVRYIGIAPVQASTTLPNWDILDHRNPLLLGNGTTDDSIGINPGGGLGLGNQYSVGTNAAYEVQLVPEPTLLAFSGASILACVLKKKRKSRKV